MSGACGDEVTNGSDNVKLVAVTLTGADDTISSSWLGDLSKLYPFVEWGILLSQINPQERKARFPTRSWLEELWAIPAQQLSVAYHLCSDLARMAIREGFMPILDTVLTGEHAQTQLTRVQLNVSSYFDLMLESAMLRDIDLAQRRGIDVIIQVGRDQRWLDWVISVDMPGVHVLFDSSGGRGVYPDEWPGGLTGVRCGYAGGISSENIIEVLGDIDDVHDGDSWIDMESSLRHTRPNGVDMFDHTKAGKVLSLVSQFIS